MTTTELNRAVAHRTGETPDRIARHGFQLIGEGGRSSIDPQSDPQADPESFCIDWDAADATRYADCHIDPFPPLSKRTAIA